MQSLLVPVCENTPSMQTRSTGMSIQVILVIFQRELITKLLCASVPNGVSPGIDIVSGFCRYFKMHEVSRRNLTNREDAQPSIQKGK